MENNQYKLCIEVLKRMEAAGLLKDVVLIGSWCLPFYKGFFGNVPYFPSIKTRDIDFLVSSPGAIHTKIDLPDLLKDLGFIRNFRGDEGYQILEHPDLAIEFLVPERGRGTDKPVSLPRLGMNAQALRFLEFLQRDTIRVEIERISIVLPHPVNFALHKLIIASRRSKKDKSTKDREAALGLLNSLVKAGHKAKIKEVFESLPIKWRQTIEKELALADEKNIFLTTI